MAHGFHPRVFHFLKITIVILSLVAERLEDMREKWTKIGAFVAVAGMALTGRAVELDLAGEWTLSGSNEVGQAISCPIAVPGDTHTSLLAAKLIPNPFWGCNETNVQWVGRHDWTISRSFEVSQELLDKKDVILRLEDCDTFCTVRINGVVVGRTADRFQRYDFDIKKHLRVGKNRIEGFFESAERIGNERRVEYGRSYPMSNVLWARNQALVRKPACHAGWDWGLAQMHMGFCGTVRLIASDLPRVDYVYTTQNFNADFSHCTLTAFADMSDGSVVTNRIEIENPPLWWPNGAGEQRFYEFEIAGVRKRIGLRKVEVVNERSVLADGKEGLSMAFRVNGRDVFMKGANWIPCDAFETRQTQDRYRNLLQSAADANMNMIRLWGGGQYEKDCFYDICDELGLLVWHDMMHACAVYPGDDRFLGELGKELAHQLRRLRDHASIAIWCGDNECLGAVRWFRETQQDEAFYREEWIRRSRFQEASVRRYDPTRTYWPSSPCCGPGDFGDAMKDDSKGDMHNWQVWHANRPFDAYYSYAPRFCSEFGYQSFPSPEVAETFATREQILSRAPEFEWHQKNSGGNRRIRETMLRYFRPTKDAGAELLLSQFQQGMAIKMAVDGWRAQRPRCMGTLFWQLNDNWPVASWSSVEYGGKWKPLQYLAKRFYAPVSVIAQPTVVTGRVDVTRGKVYAINDTAETVKGELRVEYWTYDGRIVSAETKPVTIAPDSSTEVDSFVQPQVSKLQPQTFLNLTLATSCGICQNDWHFGFYKDMPLADAKVKMEAEGGGGQWNILLSADKPAFFVWANCRGVCGEFSDNCLTLLPSRPVRLAFKSQSPLSDREFEGSLTVSHLRQCCRE